MLTHFQCDLCHFINMKGRDLIKGSNKDKKLIIDIRRVSLEAFWSREPGTVKGNLTIMRKMGMMDREDLGLGYWFPHLGPYLLKDEMGM